jgi:hypothetical protein
VTSGIPRERPPPVVDILDGDMNASDVCQVLRDLRFRGLTATATLSIDRPARDYLLASVLARQGKA